MASSPLVRFMVSWSENVTEKCGLRGRNDTLMNSNSRLETTVVIRLVISGSHSGWVEMNSDATGCVGHSAVFLVHLRVRPVQRVRPISTFWRGGDVRFASKVKVSWRRRQRHTAHFTGISRGANLASREGCRKPHPESLNRARKCDGLSHSTPLIWPCEEIAVSSQRRTPTARRRFRCRKAQYQTPTIKTPRLVLISMDCNMTTIWDAAKRSERCYRLLCLSARFIFFKLFA